MVWVVTHWNSNLESIPTPIVFDNEEAAEACYQELTGKDDVSAIMDLVDIEKEWYTYE